MSDEHYFSVQPRRAGRPTEVTVQIPGHELRLAAATGVFSAQRLDPGTAVLLRKAPLPGPDTQGQLLDLGCGYGPIACVLATVAPLASVVAVDVNERALDLVRVNARRLGVADRLVASTADEVAAELRFGQIWSNPPIRIGKPQMQAMITRWLPRLEPDGVAWFVVGRHLGGDSLAEWLTSQGWSVTRHASQKGFRVLRITWAPSSGAVPSG